MIRAGEIYTKRFGEDPEIEYWIAGAFDCLGDVRQAKQHYDRTIQITPEDSVTYQYLIPGEFFLRIGETKKGREILRKGLGIMEWKLAATPDNDVLRTNGLGGYYAALGDEASVRRLETYLLQKDPVFQGELPGLAGAYLRLGDREHALELMRRAVALEVPSLGLLEPTCSAHDPLASIRDEPIYRQFISQGKRRREEARARY